MKMVKIKMQNTFQALRKRFGLTQDEMAIRLGVSRSLVTMVEQSKRSYPIEALVKLNALQLLYESKQDRPAVKQERLPVKHDRQLPQINVNYFFTLKPHT